MTDRTPHPRHRIAVGAAAAVLALAVAGCTGGANRGASASPSAAPPSPTPAGSVVVGRLSFVPPEGFQPVAKPDRRNQQAAWEGQGARRRPFTAPVLDAFVERGEVGSLVVRTAEIRALVKASLPNARIEADRAVRVPGATGARVIELTYTCQKQPKGKRGSKASGSATPHPGGPSDAPSAIPSGGPSGGPSGTPSGDPSVDPDGKVRCFQVEYLVQAAGSPQYGLRYYAPAPQWDEATSGALLTSLRVGR